jgi:hypothetical protein
LHRSNSGTATSLFRRWTTACCCCSRLCRPVPRLADGGAGRKAKHDAVSFQSQGVQVKYLHRRIGGSYLKGETRIDIESDLGPHVGKDSPEFAHLHEISPIFGRQVFDLQNGLVPLVGVTTAIERDEGSRLYLSNVITGLDGSTTIFKHERLVAVGLQGSERRYPENR